MQDRADKIGARWQSRALTSRLAFLSSNRFGPWHVSSAGFPTPTSLASAARIAFFSRVFEKDVDPTATEAKKRAALGGVAQLVRALPCHGRGYGFESRHSRHLFLGMDESPAGAHGLHKER